MVKLMTLVKANPALSPEVFATRWRSEFLPQFLDVAKPHGGISRAVHNHVRPSDIRASEGLSVADWSGIGCYYLEQPVGAHRLLADTAFADLYARHAALFYEKTHLIAEEVLMYDRDTSRLPLKAFAFFKRRPDFSRRQALEYYRTTHAAVGESVSKNRLGRYIQNHVVDDYVNPDPRYDYDGGPETWFKSFEVAMDLYNDREGMAILGRDEEKFVIRDDLLHFLTDEVIVFERQAAVA